MPFITEEIWQNLLARLPKETSTEGDIAESIMVSPYPTANGDRQDDQAEAEISLVMQAIRAVRNARAQLHIPANQQLEALVEANGSQKALEEESEVIRTLSKVNPLRIYSSDSVPENTARGVTLVVDQLVVHLPLEGVVDLSAEAARLKAERDDCASNLERVSKLVSNPNFRAKAKPDVVEAEEERLKTLQERKQRLDEIIQQIGG